MARDHGKPIRRYCKLSACEVNARGAIGWNAAGRDRLSAGVGAGLSAEAGISGYQASFSEAGFSVLTC
jgi:hypothetical protein